MNNGSRRRFWEEETEKKQKNIKKGSGILENIRIR